MTTRQTVGEIAAELPAAIRVFEKYDIDYCCGGNRPLEDVCRERSISVEGVLAEVRDAQPREGAGADWTKASLRALIDHIVTTHHEYTKRQLPVLAARMAKVVEVHGPKYPDWLPRLATVFDGLYAELDGHLRKEELILFPYIADLEAAHERGAYAAAPPFGTVQNPIRMMLLEHDNAGRALTEMRDLTQGYALPADACATFRALFEGLQELEEDIHRHIHLENNILFPRAAALE